MQWKNIENEVINLQATNPRISANFLVKLAGTNPKVRGGHRGLPLSEPLAAVFRPPNRGAPTGPWGFYQPRVLLVNHGNHGPHGTPSWGGRYSREEAHGPGGGK